MHRLPPQTGTKVTTNQGNILWYNRVFFIQKCEFFRKIKEDKGLHGGVLVVRRTGKPAV